MTGRGISYQVQIFNKAGECVCRWPFNTLEEGKEMLPKLKKSILWHDCNLQLVEVESTYTLIEE